jgi:hypothetical protein
VGGLDLEPLLPQATPAAVSEYSRSDPAYTVRIQPKVASKSTGLSLGQGFATSIPAHGNCAVESFSALWSSADKVCYTSPEDFAEAEYAEQHAPWHEAWDLLTAGGACREAELDNISESVNPKVILDRVGAVVRSEGAAFSRGGPEASRALTQVTLRAAKSAGEYARFYLSSLYNVNRWTTV